MGQFKPMVKMETTEPSVILKLAKGGHVNMKKGGKAEAGHKKMAMGGVPSGSAMSSLMGTPALVGRPAVNAPVRAPGKPPMAMRRRAMMTRPAAPPMAAPQMAAPQMAAPPMKKGGMSAFEKSGKDVEKKGMPEGSKADMALDKKQMAGMKKGGMKRMAEGGMSDIAQDKAMIKKAFKQHDMQEHKGGKGTSLKLKHGGMHKMPDGKMMKNSAMKKGGMATGGVSLGNAGGFKTGGVALGNAGGFKEGGMTMVEKDGKMVPNFAADGKGKMKKGGKMSGGMMGYATGGVTMGNAGGFKMGGKTSKKAYATGGTVNSGRAVAMPQGNKPAAPSVKINQLAGTYKNGGKATPAESVLMKNNKAENATAMRQAKTQSNIKYMAGGGSTSDKEMDMSKGAYDASKKHSMELEDAMNPLSMVKELYGKARDAFRPKGEGSVTKTEKSVTVTPAGKKRGGMAC